MASIPPYKVCDQSSHFGISRLAKTPTVHVVQLDACLTCSAPDRKQNSKHERFRSKDAATIRAYRLLKSEQIKSKTRKTIFASSKSELESIPKRDTLACRAGINHLSKPPPPQFLLCRKGGSHAPFGDHPYPANRRLANATIGHPKAHRLPDKTIPILAERNLNSS